MGLPAADGGFVGFVPAEDSVLPHPTKHKQATDKKYDTTFIADSLFAKSETCFGTLENAECKHVTSQVR
jgi:hypothetical protein